MEKLVDARGMACPLPVVNAKKASEELTDGDTLTILVDNEIAVQNLTRFAAHKGFAVVSRKNAENDFAVIMQIPGSSISADTPASDSCKPDARRKGMLVVLSANQMGTGDPKLGAALMKAFVFALTRQDQLPETILCSNSGAYLTCEGADTLEDMKLLASEGVDIRTCGTCLDFYGLKDRLAVGSVTNMYDIVECMEHAQTTIRP